MTRELGPAQLTEVFRSEWSRVVATLVRLLGDLDLAEEFAQEAWLAAIERWPVAGVPERPGAWLMTTARNAALDRLRVDARRRASATTLHAHETLRQEAKRFQQHADPRSFDRKRSPPQRIGLNVSLDAFETANDVIVESDRLRLIFTCCHPALPRENRVALTLRLLGGLTTKEISAAFLISETTAAQRLVRAKKAIRDRRLPYRIPEAAELSARIPAVLDVLYLMFNAGYAAASGSDLVKSQLCIDAIDLVKMLVQAFPEASEVIGLFALFEFQAAREAARIDSAGHMILLADQDREKWDRTRIEEASERLQAALLVAPDRGPFIAQAQIAESHARAASFETTDWPRIVGLYDDLCALIDSPIVQLNRAVAIGQAEGEEAGIEALERITPEPRFDHYGLFEATRADFLRRLGRYDAAADAYRSAVAMTDNRPQKSFLESRLRECESERKP